MCEDTDILTIASQQAAFMATELTLTYNCGVVITGIAGDRVKFTLQMDANYAELLQTGVILASQSQTYLWCMMHDKL